MLNINWCRISFITCFLREGNAYPTLTAPLGEGIWFAQNSQRPPCMFHKNHTQNPIGFMEMVYLPTFTINFQPNVGQSSSPMHHRIHGNVNIYTMYAGKYTISMDHGQWYMGEHLERWQFVSKPCEGELMDLSFFRVFDGPFWGMMKCGF